MQSALLGQLEERIQSENKTCNILTKRIVLYASVSLIFPATFATS